MIKSSQQVKDNNITKVKDANTTALVNEYLIYFFNKKSVTVANKNSKLIDLLLNSNIIAEDIVLNKSRLNIYSNEIEMLKLKEKQIELGYTSFTQFVNMTLFNFYKEHHIIKEKLNTPKKKNIIDINKFNIFKKQAKKQLMNGNYASYNNNVLRETSQYKNISNFMSIAPKELIRNSDIGQALSMDIHADTIEIALINYIRAKTKIKCNYSDFIGVIPKRINIAIPDINTYLYLWLYYIFQENNIFKNINIEFNTNTEYIDKLLDKYTIYTIFKKSNDIDEEFNYHMIFDTIVMNKINNNELINLKEIYDTTI